jgi:hypothetical protein
MLGDVRIVIFRLLECKYLHTPVLNQRAALTNGGETQVGPQSPKENYMDPSQIAPYSFSPPSEQPQLAVAPAAPLNGEVLPPEQPPVVAVQTDYPIGLIDFNQPIVVIDTADYSDEEFDNATMITVLKGSLHPVVVSFWKHGEQCVAQFDTDGDSSCGDYKVEQDQPYPRTVFVVIGREGRNLVLDEELYTSEEAARAETDLDEVAGVFPLVVEAPAPTLVNDVAGAASQVSDFHDGGVEGEEDENEVEGTEGAASNVTDINQPPTEMYVAGRMRYVGETVHAYRNNFGTRACIIVKMRRDSRKSLFLNPQDGNEPYWALNKNVHY